MSPGPPGLYDLRSRKSGWFRVLQHAVLENSEFRKSFRTHGLWTYREFRADFFPIGREIRID